MFRLSRNVFNIFLEVLLNDAAIMMACLATIKDMPSYRQVTSRNEETKILSFDQIFKK